MSEIVMAVLAAVGIVSIADRVVRWLVRRDMRGVSPCVYLPISRRVMCVKDWR